MQPDSTIRLCRICLVVDVKMYQCDSNLFNYFYEEVLGYKVFSCKTFSSNFCYQCAYLLFKFNEFKKKCVRGQKLIEYIEHSFENVDCSVLDTIDRESENLVSPLTTRNEKSKFVFFDYVYNYNTHDVKDEICSDSEGAWHDDFPDDMPLATAIALNPCNSSYEYRLKDENKDGKINIENNTVITTVCKDYEKNIDYLNVNLTNSLNSNDLKGPNVKDIHSVCASKKLKNKKTNKKSNDICKKNSDTNNKGTNNFKDENWKVIYFTKDEQLTRFNDRQLVKDYRTKKYTCDYCQQGFRSKTSYKVHKSKHIKKPHYVECWLCKLQFKNKAQLQEHRLKHERMFSCKHCAYTADDLYKVQRHDLTHENSHNNFHVMLCQLCNMKFRRKTSYELHMRTCHRPDYLCRLCGLNFPSEDRRTSHVTLIHSQQYSQTAPPTAAVQSEQAPEPAWYCGACGVQFASAGAYGTHLETASQHLARDSANPKAGRTSSGIRNQFAQNKQKTVLDEQFWTIRQLSEREQEAEFRERRAKNMKHNYEYSCKECLRGFKSAALLVSHMRHHSKDNGPFECKLCYYRFKWACHLRVHNKVHHANKFECKRCPFTTISKDHTIRHDDFHKGVSYNCEKCNMKFRNLSSLRTHLRVKHRSGVVCTRCGANFLSAAGLDAHTKFAHPPEEGGSPAQAGQFHCDTCSMDFQNEQAYALHFTTSDKHDDLNSKGATQTLHPRYRNRYTVRCDECNEDIADYQYVRHCKAKHPGAEIKKTFICEQCGFFATTHNLLTAHKESHSEPKYPCPECGKKFKTRTVLWTHRLIHKGIRKYQCPECSKQFVQSCDMKMHYRRIHLKEPMPKRVRKRDDRSSVLLNQLYHTSLNNS